MTHTQKDNKRTLTDVKLEALVNEGVAAPSCLVVLFEDQDLLADPGQQVGRSQPADPTAHHDSIEVLRHLVNMEACKGKQDGI